MNFYLDKALKKLEEEYKSGSFDKYANIMKRAVKDTLADFCRQDDEFAQAVVQGGSFTDCMKAVAKSCGTGISDLEAYSRAVKFYMPGADIKFQMQIIQKGAAKSATLAAAVPEPAGVLIDITDLL